MKRLRENFSEIKINPETGKNKKYYKQIKFYQCGEYGDDNGRPHYHACIFGIDFDDKELWKIKNGYRLYTSEKLSKLWKHGYAVIGDVTFESAAYTARYIMKKINGNQEPHHYLRINYETGELFYLQPEYTTMSLGGRQGKGLGQGWYEKYKDDTYHDDTIIMRGLKMRPPRYYDNMFDIDEPDKLNEIKKERKRHSIKNKEDNTPERLRVKEKVKQAQLRQLKRNL